MVNNVILLKVPFGLAVMHCFSFFISITVTKIAYVEYHLKSLYIFSTNGVNRANLA